MTKDDDQSSIVIYTKFPVGIVEEIDFWVEKKKYRSRSEFVNSAVRDYLDDLLAREDRRLRVFDKDGIREVPGPQPDTEKLSE